MEALNKRNCRVNLELDWRELGLGCILYKPLYRPFPRKCFWIGLSFRQFWGGIFIKLWERKSVNTNVENYDQMQRMKEISAFHSKELIEFKNHGSLDVFWQWNRMGIMIYYRSKKGSSIPDYISIDFLWASASYSSNQ